MTKKIIAGLFISLDGVVEDPHLWHFPYFNDEMGEAVGHMMMGETMLFNYSFTDRLDSTLRGSEAELLELQRATQPRIPVEDICDICRASPTHSHVL